MARSNTLLDNRYFNKLQVNRLQSNYIKLYNDDNNDISYLFSIICENCTLQKNKKNTYYLTIFKNNNNSVIKFSDRPIRVTSYISINEFISLFNPKNIDVSQPQSELSFYELPPNIVLVYKDKQQSFEMILLKNDNDNVIFELKLLEDEERNKSFYKNYIVDGSESILNGSMTLFIDGTNVQQSFDDKTLYRYHIMPASKGHYSRWYAYYNYDKSKKTKDYIEITGDCRFYLGNYNGAEGKAMISFLIDTEPITSRTIYNYMKPKVNNFSFSKNWSSLGQWQIDMKIFNIQSTTVIKSFYLADRTKYNVNKDAGNTKGTTEIDIVETGWGDAAEKKTTTTNIFNFGDLVGQLESVPSIIPIKDNTKKNVELDEKWIRVGARVSHKKVEIYIAYEDNDKWSDIEVVREYNSNKNNFNQLVPYISMWTTGKNAEITPNDKVQFKNFIYSPTYSDGTLRFI
jgi:hypothetical protein